MACPPRNITNGPCSEDKQTDSGYYSSAACANLCASNCQEYLYVKNTRQSQPYFHEAGTLCSWTQHYTGPNCDQNGGQTDDKFKITYYFGWDGSCVCGGAVCGQEGCMVG